MNHQLSRPYLGNRREAATQRQPTFGPENHQGPYPGFGMDQGEVDLVPQYRNPMAQNHHPDVQNHYDGGVQEYPHHADA